MKEIKKFEDLLKESILKDIKNSHRKQKEELKRKFKKQAKDLSDIWKEKLEEN